MKHQTKNLLQRGLDSAEFFDLDHLFGDRGEPSEEFATGKCGAGTHTKASLSSGKPCHLKRKSESRKKTQSDTHLKRCSASDSNHSKW